MLNNNYLTAMSQEWLKSAPERVRMKFEKDVAWFFVEMGTMLSTYKTQMAEFGEDSNEESTSIVIYTRRQIWPQGSKAE